MHARSILINEWNNRPLEDHYARFSEYLAAQAYIPDAAVVAIKHKLSLAEADARTWKQSFDKLIETDMEFKSQYEVRETALLNEINSLKASIGEMEQWPPAAIDYANDLKAQLKAEMENLNEARNTVRDLNYKIMNFKYELARLTNDNARLRVKAHEADEVPDNDLTISYNVAVRIIDEEIQWYYHNPELVTDHEKHMFVKGLQQARQFLVEMARVKVNHNAK
jgi:hypothetical protein